MNTNLVREAQIFATAAHEAVSQKRKYTNEPYINHPAQLVTLITVFGSGHTPEILAAAWLHDVVEDTGVSLDTIKLFFGPVIASYVEQLTDVSKPEDGNRTARKAIDLAHTALCSPEAATIKLADLISNTQSITAYDLDFAAVYIPEKIKLLKVLKHGDANLYAMAKDICKTAMSKL